MNKLIGSIFIAWALLRNVGVAPPELPQCIPPPPLEEALLPDGTEPVLPAAAEVREKSPSYPESVLQREIASPEPIRISSPTPSPEIIYVDPNIPWSYFVQAVPPPTYYQPIQTFPFYNCTTSS